MELKKRIISPLGRSGATRIRLAKSLMAKHRALGLWLLAVLGGSFARQVEFAMYSDEIESLLRFISDTDPKKPGGHGSEAMLNVDPPRTLR